MNRIQRNAFEMFKTVKDYLEENREIWSGIQATVAAVEDLGASIASVREALRRQKSPIQGITGDKLSLRDELEDLILVVGGGLAAYASVAKDQVLASQVAMTAAELDKLSQQFVEDAAERVLVAVGNYPSVVPAYVSADEVTELQALKEEFSGKKSGSQVARSKRAGATDSLDEQLRATKELLNERLDKLMRRYRLRRAEFFTGYQKARIIVDRSGTGEEEEPPMP